MFYFYINLGGIYSSGFNNNFMASLELHEVFWSIKFYTLINLEYGYLIFVMSRELNEGIGGLEWWMLWSGGISKEVAGGIINTGEG